MDIREHSLALISVVIGLGLTSLLGCFNRLMRRRRELRWNALPLTWAFIALLMVLNYWWGIYLGQVAAMAVPNVGTFMLALAFPILLYLICAAALPDVHALRVHHGDLLAVYFAESRYFFTLIVLYVIATGWATAVHAGSFHWNEHMWMRLAIVCFCLPLPWTRRLLLHWSAAAVMLAIMVYVLFEAALH
ncbi:hypothetical protein [Dyella agri]|uniref:AraC family transcriptional regulator n=1 Tax=Dyella agri TaxID=1926869 RepID=A0ABW8KHV9_9GAMM